MLTGEEVAAEAKNGYWHKDHGAEAEQGVSILQPEGECQERQQLVDERGVGCYAEATKPPRLPGIKPGIHVVRGKKEVIPTIPVPIIKARKRETQIEKEGGTGQQ